MPHDGGRRVIAVVAIVVGVLVVAALLAQLILPRLAADRISSRIGRYGKVEDVTVSAWPAVKLLWGDADSVHIRAGRLDLSPAQASALLWESRGVSSMDVSAEAVKLGPLALEGVSLSKRGEELAGAGSTTAAQAAAALPPGVSATLLASHQGTVEVRVAGGLFGIAASVTARAEAREGRLVVHPVGFLIEGLQLTLLDDPHVRAESIAAAVTADQPLTYRLSMQALLR
jgi:hypothetical protein